MSLGARKYTTKREDAWMQKLVYERSNLNKQIRTLQREMNAWDRALVNGD